MHKTYKFMRKKVHHGISLSDSTIMICGLRYMKYNLKSFNSFLSLLMTKGYIPYTGMVREQIRYLNDFYIILYVFPGDA